MSWAITMGLALGVVLAGCTRQPSPEEVRQKTADTAAALKQDAVAVAQGVRQGLSSEKVDVNHATREQLLALPGMDGEQADRIIAKGPTTSRTICCAAICSTAKSTSAFPAGSRHNKSAASRRRLARTLLNCGWFGSH